MYFLDELENSQKGEKLVLICGGVGTIKQLYSIPNLDQFQIAGCNQHAIIIPSLAWVFAHDERMVRWLVEQEIPFPIISHRLDDLRDKDIQAATCPYVQLTGAEALWTAGILGYEEIHILGADDYGHPYVDYWHQFHTKDEPVDTKRGRQHNVKPWRTVLSDWKFTKNVFFYSGLKRLVKEVF